MHLPSCFVENESTACEHCHELLLLLFLCQFTLHIHDLLHHLLSHASSNVFPSTQLLLGPQFIITGLPNPLQVSHELSSLSLQVSHSPSSELFFEEQCTKNGIVHHTHMNGFNSAVITFTEMSHQLAL